MDDRGELRGRSWAIPQRSGTGSVVGRRVGILMGLAAAVSFASMGSIAKLAYERGASVPALLALRFGVGSVFWLVLLGPGIRRTRWYPRTTAWVIVAGAVGGGLSSLAEFSSYRLLPVAIVTVLLFASPLWLASFAQLLHGRHIGKRSWAAAILLLVGLFLLVARPGRLEASMLGIGSPRICDRCNPVCRDRERRSFPWARPNQCSSRMVCVRSYGYRGHDLRRGYERVGGA